jgi:hypothetical protein
MPSPGSASGGTASDDNEIEGLSELIDLLNDDGEALLGLQGGGTELTANHTGEPAGTSAHACTVASASELFATANYLAGAPAARPASTTAAKPRRNVKLSSSKKLEY